MKRSRETIGKMESQQGQDPIPGRIRKVFTMK
jgi:hypothetical protein